WSRSKASTRPSSSPRTCCANRCDTPWRRVFPWEGPTYFFITEVAMNTTLRLFAVVLGLHVAWLLTGGEAMSVARADDVPEEAQEPEGEEVQTRGPIHEAYAAPEGLDPHPAPIVPKKPPDPVPEMPPEQKPDGDHVIWIPGYWAWDDETADFLWISGFW